VDIQLMSIDPHTHKSTSKFMTSIHPGDHFGDSSIIAKCPRTASCIATKRSLCLALGKEHFVKTFQVSTEEIEWWKTNVVAVQELAHPELNRFVKSSTLQRFDLGTSFAIGGLNHLMFIRSGRCAFASLRLPPASPLHPVRHPRAELGVQHLDIGIKTLAELNVGDCFGEAGMFSLNQSSWMVTATGREPLVVLAIPYQVMREFPRLADRLKRLAVARQHYLDDRSMKQPIILQRSSGLVLQRSANGKLIVAVDAMVDAPVALPNTASKVKVLPEDPFPVESLCRQPSHRSPAPRTPRPGPAAQLPSAVVAPSPVPSETSKGLPCGEASIASSVKSATSFRERSVPDPDAWGKGSATVLQSGFRISRTSSQRNRQRRLSKEYPRISTSDGVNLPDIDFMMKVLIPEQRSRGDKRPKAVGSEASAAQASSYASSYLEATAMCGAKSQIPF
ncbi:hypothetical protein CYMTET_30652, partial [Cymbomonas tetramitiformis]